MRIRYIKGTRVIGGVSIGDGEFFTFSAAHLKDPYIHKRIRKALLEGKVEEIPEKEDAADADETKRRELLTKANDEYKLDLHPNSGIKKIEAAIANYEAELATKKGGKKE